MRVVVITPPEPVVTLQEAKRHLGVDDGERDTLIEAFVAAATGHIDGPDGWLGRAIGVQTLEAAVQTWAIPENIRLPFPPLIAVESISYRDADRQKVDVPADRYEVVDGLLEATGVPAWSNARPAKNGLRVRYKAGYSKLPAPIRAAILLMVGDLWRNRGEAGGAETAQRVAMSTTVENLLSPYRVFS
nr:phage head-tail connector protein [uncultured Sphingomonas sp.]